MAKKGTKTVAQQLQLAQRINQQAERLAGLGYWEWDLVEDRLTYCSEGYARILETTVEEALVAEASSEMTQSFIHPGDRQRYIDAEEEDYEAGVGVDIEYRVITAKGRVRHLHEISEVVKNNAGEVIRSSGILQDITDFKQQQEELRRTLANALRAETLAKLGTYTWNWVEDQLESCSEEYARILNLTVEQTLNIYHSSEAHFATIHPDDREAFKAVEAAALARGEGYTADYRALLPDGGLGHMRLICEAELNDRGEVIRTTGSIQDVTEQILLQEQLRQALKIQAIGQLTGGIAHDFNNLLMVIMGNLDLAMDSLGKSSPATEFLADALQAGERGATLIQRLLAFARKQSLQLETVDLQSLVLGLKELLQRTLGKTIRVEIQDSGRQWLCETDPSQFESTILNLAINARDAMPNGGTLHIALDSVQLDEDDASAKEAVCPGPYIRLSVSDTGLGMPSDVQARAFDPFFTTKDVGEGTGLGLSMVYGFLKQCRGHASIYSEPGEGTVVKLYLPHHPEGSVESPVVSLDGEIRGNNEQILVVEDDPQVRELAVLLLADLGYSPIEAKDGREALHLLGSESAIALLFSDVILPGMSGVELAEAARRSYPDLKVLFTSGYTRNTAQRWRVAGYELLEKPYSKAQLAYMLSRAFAR